VKKLLLALVLVVASFGASADVFVYRWVTGVAGKDVYFGLDTLACQTVADRLAKHWTTNYTAYTTNPAHLYGAVSNDPITYSGHCTGVFTSTIPNSRTVSYQGQWTSGEMAYDGTVTLELVERVAADVDALGLAPGEALNVVWIGLIVGVFAMGFIGGQQR